MATALDKTGLSKMLCFMQGKVYETRHVEGECTYLRHNKSLVLTDSRPLPSATSSGQIASSPRKLRPLRSRLAKFGSALAPAQARVCSCWPGRPRLTRIARQASREAGSSTKGEGRMQDGLASERPSEPFRPQFWPRLPIVRLSGWPKFKKWLGCSKSI